MREIKVTIANKDGEVLDTVELMWDQDRYPATRVVVTPVRSDEFVTARHPAQCDLVIGQ